MIYQAMRGGSCDYGTWSLRATLRIRDRPEIRY